MDLALFPLCEGRVVANPAMHPESVNWDKFKH